MVSPNAPENAPERYGAIIMESGSQRWVGPLEHLELATLHSCAFEDPATWQDIVLLWPRHRFHVSMPESAEDLPQQTLDLEDAMAAAREVDGWVAIDVVQRRLLTGGTLRLDSEPSDEELERFTTSDEDWDHDEEDAEIYRDPEDSVSDDDSWEDEDVELSQAVVPTPSPAEDQVLLPPWWEYVCGAPLERLRQQRETPPVMPRARRDVLWGLPMRTFFAEAIIATAVAGQAVGKPDENHPAAGSHARTVEIHRDWLMTPREELQGATPREILHGAMAWVERLASIQAHRASRGLPLVPVSTKVSTYAQAPPGRHEIIMYFDACRELLAAGWRWLQDRPEQALETGAVEALAAELEQRLQVWLGEPFEGEGATPGEIIEADRARVPLMDGGRGGGHALDCDCPLCQMIAEGAFGPAIIGFDGHHLELDNEFAFSLCADRASWEVEQGMWQAAAEGPDDRDDSVALERVRGGAAPMAEAPDELASPWQRTFVSDEPGPLGAHSLLGLAFFMAEVVGTLQEIGALKSDVDALNHTFRDFRKAVSPGEFHSAAGKLMSTLESLAQRHPQLVGRSADLQSRVQEFVRHAANAARDRDMPF